MVHKAVYVALNEIDGKSLARVPNAVTRAVDNIHNSSMINPSLPHAGIKPFPMIMKSFVPMTYSPKPYNHC